MCVMEALLYLLNLCWCKIHSIDEFKYACSELALPSLMDGLLVKLLCETLH